MHREKDHLKELSEALSRLSTTDQRARKVASYLGELYPDPGPIVTLNAASGNVKMEQQHPDPPFGGSAFYEMLAGHGVSATDLVRALPPRSKFVLDRPPCAFINLATREECQKNGISVCTNCRLVAYCSQVCQKKHWIIHKQDCKANIRSNEWQPAWIAEGRPPRFVMGAPRRVEPESKLWGHTPAVDILNLPEGVAEASDSLNIAFVASGDLRNLVRTVNGLPRDYRGKLTVILNDHNKSMFLRNIILLLTLGTILDKGKAADIALHAWYSAFIPHEYHTEILCLAKPVYMGTDSLKIKIGDKAKLQAHIGSDIRNLCAALLMSSGLYDASDATNQLSSARFHPSRTDIRHGQYILMEPSHRLASLEYLRFGLLLPFGAHNAYFNTPNRLLFTPTGEWQQAGLESPLNGWDIEEVVQSGKAHGATREDIYGCLYFHLSDQLGEFADRLRRFNLSVKVICEDAVDLSNKIFSGDLATVGLSPSIRFDRIDLSSVMDERYVVGVQRTIDGWGKLLKRTPQSAMIAHFLHWVEKQLGAEPTPELCDLGAVHDDALAKGRHVLPPSLPESGKPDAGFEVKLAHWLSGMTPAIASVYDNSAPFKMYLALQGLHSALARSNLRLKQKHDIVPHRLCAPLNGPPSALPDFKDKESWYLQNSIGRLTWTERFIEICPAST